MTKVLRWTGDAHGVEKQDILRTPVTIDPQKRRQPCRRNTMMCYNCGKPGHPARRCLNNEVLFERGSRVKENSNKGMYRKGTVDGCHVNSILLDTGCSRTMVRRQSVPQDKENGCQSDVCMATPFFTP